MTLIQNGGEYFRFHFNRQGNRDKGNAVLLLSSLPSPLQMGQKYQVSVKSSAHLKPAVNGF